MSAPTWSFGVPSQAPTQKLEQPAAPQADGPDPLAELREQIQRSWLGAGVDLLPEHYRVARRVGAAQRGVVAGLLAVGLLLGGAAWQAHAATSSAEAELAEVNSRQAALTAQAAQLAEVPRVLGELATVQTARSTAFATDVRWYSYLDGLRSSVPTGVWLADLSWGSAGGSSTDAAAAGAASTTQPATTTEDATGTAGTQGTLTVKGRTQDPALVAAWLESVSATTGLADPSYSSLQRIDIDGTPVYEFTATVAVTDAALSHRFDTPASGTSGSAAATTPAATSTPATGAGS